MQTLILAVLIANPTLSNTKYVKSCMRYTLKKTRNWSLTKRDMFNYCKCVEINLVYQYGTSDHISTEAINQHCRSYMHTKKEMR